ncbi:MAG: recombination mediator RecR [Vulcanimicrobiota bacterium]
MYEFPQPVERLVEALMELPTIGPKSAHRLAFFLLHARQELVEELAESMLDVKRKIHDCARCGNLTEREFCSICSDSRRDAGLLCVVSDPRDIAALERTNEFRGRYHVLGGLISPMDGIGPDRLRIDSLLDRVRRENIQEVILATNPTVAGEATALFLHRQLASGPVRVTRLAQGLPMGSDLEYADEVTLGRALQGRRDF